jgi:hypothetical protein
MLESATGIGALTPAGRPIAARPTHLPPAQGWPTIAWKGPARVAQILRVVASSGASRTRTYESVTLSGGTETHGITIATSDRIGHQRSTQPGFRTDAASDTRQMLSNSFRRRRVIPARNEFLIRQQFELSRADVRRQVGT